MAMEFPGAVGGAGRESPTLIALLVEMIALRHQIAVLKRSGTRRPCFRLRDRWFWLLLARWWPGWRDSLVIVQPATVLRWRRGGWSGLWRYRSRGRWRGGRPRISRELRRLIVRMARENFLWGAPRIHGELLMLGFAVSQASVSRYMPPANRRRGQSWRTFIRNEALAFRRDEDTADQSVGDDAGLRGRSHSSRAACFEGEQHQARRPLAVSHRSWRVVSDSGQVPIAVRSPPYRARASPRSGSLLTQALRSVVAVGL
jgi:hypothetical protein